MTTRANSRDPSRWFNQINHIDDPHISSPAALVMLAKMYLTLDLNIYRNKRMHRLRNRWLKEQLKNPDEMGGLTCSICMKKGLIIRTKDKNKLATLDHIIMLKDGGPWNDPSNFRVTCLHCNRQLEEASYKLPKKNAA